MDLPFYEQIKEIIPKMQIRSYHVPTRADKCRLSFNFGVSSEDADKLDGHWQRSGYHDLLDGRRARRSNHRHHELQLRIFFPEPGKNVVPRVRLNNQDVDLPNQDAHAQQNLICIDITSFCIKFGISKGQELKFEWDSNAEAVCEYTILLVKSQTPDVLIDQMRANSNTKRPLELTKTAIIAQIKARKTEDFEFSAMKISLIDPLTRKLIKIPAKGSNCTHLRCFDLRNFLALNDKSTPTTWKCPICKRNANFVNLKIDEYFEKILKDNAGNLKEVEIFHDGTWRLEKANPARNAVNVAANLEKDKENDSENVDSEQQLERKRNLTDSALRGLVERELPFYELKKVLVPVMAFNSLPNMGFCACQIEVEDIFELQPPMELQLRMYLFDVADNVDLELDEFPLPTIHLGKSKVEYLAQHNVWISEYEPLVVNLTPTFKKQEEKSQNIHLKWNGKEQAWAFSVVLINRLDSLDLQHQMCRQISTICPNFETKIMIRQQLTSNDTEIEVNTMKISLLDSLTRKRIQIPSRSRNCEHVQCFDLHNYLMMNEMRPAWKCPICNGDANYSKLCIDRYFQNVLQETENSVEEVELWKDGTWHLCTAPIQKNAQECGYHNNTTVVMENQDDVGNADVVCLSSDDENEENGEQNSSSTASTSNESSSRLSTLRKRLFTINYDYYVAPRVKEEPSEEPVDKRRSNSLKSYVGLE